MAQKVAKAGIKKEDGYLYFINKNGDIARVAMARGGRKKGVKRKKEVVKKLSIKKEPGYLYFVDKNGDVSRAPMARGRKAKKRRK